MTAFRDQETLDQAGFFNADEYGESATYSDPTTGVATPLVVLLGEGQESDSEWAGGQSVTRPISIKRSDIDSPRKQAVIEIDETGEQWQIANTIAFDRYQTTVVGVKTLRPRR